MAASHNVAEDAHKTPLVSVGMPLYNAAPWIEKSVRSILDQTVTDLELILCDNASTDDSQAICERLAAADARVRYHRHEYNIGANRNYQATLDLAKGRYFKWASSSDLCAPTFLEDCIAVLDAHEDVVLAAGRTVLFQNSTEDGVLYEDDFALLGDDAFERYQCICTRLKLNNVLNGVARATVMHQLIPLGAFERADNAMMAELALRGKVALLDKPLFYRRMTRATATKLKSDKEAQTHILPAAAKRPLLWQRWRFHLALLRVAMRAPRFGKSSLRTFCFALRQMIWARSELAGDVRQAVRQLV